MTKKMNQTKKATAKKTATKKIAPKMPAWLAFNANSSYCQLSHVGHDGGHLQDIEVTVQEFIALKRHLAAIRGLIPTDAAVSY